MLCKPGCFDWLWSSAPCYVSKTTQPQLLNWPACGPCLLPLGNNWASKTSSQSEEQWMVQTVLCDRNCFRTGKNHFSEQVALEVWGKQEHDLPQVLPRYFSGMLSGSSNMERWAPVVKKCIVFAIRKEDGVITKSPCGFITAFAQISCPKSVPKSWQSLLSLLGEM